MTDVRCVFSKVWHEQIFAEEMIAGTVGLIFDLNIRTEHPHRTSAPSSCAEYL